MGLFHIICKLPNASELINDVKFVAHEFINGAVMTAEAVEADVAAMFEGIPGYEIVDENAPAATGAGMAQPVAKKKAGRPSNAEKAARAAAAAASDGSATDEPAAANSADDTNVETAQAGDHGGTDAEPAESKDDTESAPAGGEPEAQPEVEAQK